MPIASLSARRGCLSLHVDRNLERTLDPWTKLSRPRTLTRLPSGMHLWDLQPEVPRTIAGNTYNLHIALKDATSVTGTTYLAPGMPASSHGPARSDGIDTQPTLLRGVDAQSPSPSAALGVKKLVPVHAHKTHCSWSAHVPPIYSGPGGSFVQGRVPASLKYNMFLIVRPMARCPVDFYGRFSPLVLQHSPQPLPTRTVPVAPMTA